MTECYWSGCKVPPIGELAHKYATGGSVCFCAEHDLRRALRPPASPLDPDPRLFALQEQIAKALERIADALEGLQNPLRQSCKLAFTSITGAGCICDEPRGHDGAHYSRGTYKMENIG